MTRPRTTGPRGSSSWPWPRAGPRRPTSANCIEAASRARSSTRARVLKVQPLTHDARAREVVAELLDPDPAARLAAGAALEFEFVRGFVAYACERGRVRRFCYVGLSEEAAAGGEHRAYRFIGGGRGLVLSQRR